jgi:undecaprenyl diphosphate synthase|tara:strand:+ start:2622 stop:3332 length:711 start_codon:yes stop_codon:yes gene_type:complete
MDNDQTLRHLAIIMDGNGRWALNQDLPRTAGHAAGEDSLSLTIDWAIKNRIDWLTVYAFSTENWLRSKEEVDFLMYFNRDILIRRRDEFKQKGVRFLFLGDLTDSKIPDENKNLMKETEEITKNNNTLNLVFAFNYGSHNEIHNAVLDLHNENINEKLELEDVENIFYNFFQYPEAPFPDLLLRTAGEKRISNFMLYQLSYSELIFINTLWPDVNEDILDDVLLEFNRRNRTYGRS